MPAEPSKSFANDPTEQPATNIRPNPSELHDAVRLITHIMYTSTIDEAIGYIRLNLSF